MRILVKFPTRNRKDQFLKVLSLYITKATNLSQLSFLITLDSDDQSMVECEQEIRDILKDTEHKIVYGLSKNKIDAVNRDLNNHLNYDWDIVLLASDDMIPVFDGYDEVIRLRMQETYPDTDGVLWFNDGHTENRLNTLACMGKKYYTCFGYIYNPTYKSLYCDNEFMDQANLLKKMKYFSEVIIEHKHPHWGCVPDDELYKQNQVYMEEDARCYFQSKIYPCDISLLIVSLSERASLLNNLLKNIQLAKEKTSLRIEVLMSIDNREKSTGQKRNELVAKAKGKYCCFVDDDDEISPHYFTEIEEALKETPNADVVSMLGMFYVKEKAIKPFVHSRDFTSNWEDDDGFYRLPNHLNPILTGFAKMIRFPEISYGEDTDFALRMYNTGFLKTEAKVKRLLYHYFYVPKPKSLVS